MQYTCLKSTKVTLGTLIWTIFIHNKYKEHLGQATMQEHLGHIRKENKIRKQ